MTIVHVRTAVRLSVALVCLAACGCFVPGGGWTMRGGLDFRRPRKPSAFVELVDSRWDEYNRIADLNIAGGMVESNVVTPIAPPSNGAPVIPGPVVPPPSGAPAPVDSQSAEPHPLPGMPDEPPTPESRPTARRPSGTARYLPSSNRESPSLRPTAPGEVGDDVLQEDEEDEDAHVDLSAYSRVSSGPAGTRGNRNSGASAQKGPLRPAASRLFSRPR